LSYTRELERSFCVREPAFAKRLRRAAFAFGRLPAEAPNRREGWWGR